MVIESMELCKLGGFSYITIIRVSFDIRGRNLVFGFLGIEFIYFFNYDLIVFLVKVVF